MGNVKISNKPLTQDGLDRYENSSIINLETAIYKIRFNNHEAALRHVKKAITALEHIQDRGLVKKVNES